MKSEAVKKCISAMMMYLIHAVISVGRIQYLTEAEIAKIVVTEAETENKKCFEYIVDRIMNCSPSSRQLKKYKFFLPAEIFLLAVFMQLASKFRVLLLIKYQSFVLQIITQFA